MEMRIAGDKWIAEVLIVPTEGQEKTLNCYATTKAVIQEDALRSAQYILELFAKGRTAFIRVSPEVGSERDANTGEMKHKGFVRFSFRQEPGEWHYPAEMPEMISFGYAKSKA